MSMQRGIEKEVPEEVRRSRFGCGPCLWGGVECRNGSLYKEEIEVVRPDKRSKKTKEVRTCGNYTYCD